MSARVGGRLARVPSLPHPLKFVGSGGAPTAGARSRGCEGWKRGARGRPEALLAVARARWVQRGLRPRKCAGKVRGGGYGERG